jgi:glycosyltransferase involved in cell wall biosynthesis
VLALGHTAELGGAEIGLLHMARHLPVDLRVVLLEDGPLVRRLRAAGCAVEVRPPDGLRRTVLEEVERHAADVVLLNTFRVTRLVAACRLPRRVRCVTMLRDGLRPPHLRRRESVVGQVAVNAVSRAVVANSAWTRTQLVTPRPTFVVPPFVDERFFAPPAPRPADGALRVLLLARMAHWKGQLLGLRALAECRIARRLRVSVAGGSWFGETGHEQKVRRAAEQSGLDVRVLGHVDDVVPLIDRHDVLLHTSLMPEPFGQVVVQGMARGKVVVAADRGGPAEVIRPGRDGLLYRMGSGSDLVRAIEEVDAGVAGMGERAAATARRYHPARTGGRLRAVLDEVAG